MPRAAMPIGGRRLPSPVHWPQHAAAPPPAPRTPHLANGRPSRATTLSPHSSQSAIMQAATLAPARPGALVVRARPSAPRASLRRGATLVRASADREAAPQAEQLAATALLAAAGLLAPMVLDTEAAQAVPELLKGRTFSLIHPGERQAGAGGMPWRAAPRPAGATAAPPPRQAAARELAYHLSSPNLLPPFCSHHGLPVWRLPVGRLPGPPVAPRAVRGGAKGLLGSGCSDTALPPAACALHGSEAVVSAGVGAVSSCRIFSSSLRHPQHHGGRALVARVRSGVGTPCTHPQPSSHRALALPPCTPYPLPSPSPATASWRA